MKTFKLTLASLLSLPCIALAQSGSGETGRSSDKSRDTSTAQSGMGAEMFGQVNWSICPTNTASARSEKSSMNMPGEQHMGDKSMSGDMTMSEKDMGDKSMSEGMEKDELGVGAQTGTEAESAHRGFISEVEQALANEKAYRKGQKPDGTFDKKDFEAVKKFQTKEKLTATGCLDQPTLDALGIAIQINDLMMGDHGDTKVTPTQDQKMNNPVRSDDKMENPIKDEDMGGERQGEEPLPR